MRVFLLAGAFALLLTACSPGPATPTSSQTPAEPPASGPALKPAMSATFTEAEHAPSTAPAECRAEIGETAAQKLADRCRMVSPATRPPCHPDNSCRMIQDEIDRSCALWDRDTSQPKPKECTA